MVLCEEVYTKCLGMALYTAICVDQWNSKLHYGYTLYTDSTHSQASYWHCHLNTKCINDDCVEMDVPLVYI